MAVLSDVPQGGESREMSELSLACQLKQHIQQGQWATWMATAQSQGQQGQVNQRIGQLAQANSNWFAVQIETNTDDRYQYGDIQHRFPLMSVIKPFLMLYVLEQIGLEALRQRVDLRPSDAPFNSLEQLQADGGRPRNPMINSGAIALADHMPGETAEKRCERLCQWLNQQVQSRLSLDMATLASVAQAGRGPNLALVEYLSQSGQLQSPQLALRTYEQICCLAGTVGDLAKIGRLLAFEHSAIAPSHRRAVNAVMLTCGLYEASPDFAVTLGVPMKSGISGALLAVIPKQGAIATYSPAIDSHGNPIAGLAFITAMANGCHLSLFG